GDMVAGQLPVWSVVLAQREEFVKIQLAHAAIPCIPRAESWFRTRRQARRLPVDRCQRLRNASRATTWPFSSFASGTALTGFSAGTGSAAVSLLGAAAGS